VSSLTNTSCPVLKSIAVFNADFFLAASSTLPICNAVLIAPGIPAPTLEATAPN